MFKSSSMLTVGGGCIWIFFLSACGLLILILEYFLLSCLLWRSFWSVDSGVDRSMSIASLVDVITTGRFIMPMRESPAPVLVGYFGFIRSVQCSYLLGGTVSTSAGATEVGSVGRDLFGGGFNDGSWSVGAMGG